MDLEPIRQIEALLNRSVIVDESRMEYFFHSFSNMSTGICGSCPAALLFDASGESASILQMEKGLSEYVRYLHYKTESERVHDISMFFSAFIEDLSSIGTTINDLLILIGKLPISTDDKWAVVDCIVNFDSYVDELHAMLQPVVEILGQNMELYSPLLNSVLQYLYSIPPDSIEQHFSDEYSMQIAPRSIGRIYPLLLAMNRLSVQCSEYADEQVTVFIGVYFREMLALQQIQSNPNDISQAVKAISDPKRLEILRSMRNEPQYGQELSERFGLTATTTHYHLNRLLTTGLVSCNVDGYRSYYLMDTKSVSLLLDRIRHYLLED